jgi:hypothetical protein
MPAIARLNAIMERHLTIGAALQSCTVSYGPANLGIKFCHLSERQTLMKLQAALVVLVMLSLPGVSEEAKPARLGVTRGYGLGSLWAEIQIDRTVYVSHDYCEAAGLIGSYPAEIRKNTVRLHVGNKMCKYHILYDRPALKRRVRNKEASDP